MNKQTSIKKHILALFCLSLMGCKPIHNFTIIPEQININSENDLSDIVICLNFFKDIRQNKIENKSFFQNKRKVKIEDSFACINSEKNYLQPVNETLTKVTTTYFKHSEIFKNVVYQKSQFADYTIELQLEEFTGELHPYEELIEITKFKQRPFFFFIPGRFFIYGVSKGMNVEKMGFKADGYFDIKFSKISIYNKDNILISEPFEITLREEGEYISDDKCWSPYWMMDYYFKEVSKKLLIKCVEKISIYSKPKKEDNI